MIVTVVVTGVWAFTVVGLVAWGNVRSGRAQMMRVPAPPSNVRLIPKDEVA